jgi:type II secretory pathway pseudopilin PulG
MLNAAGGSKASRRGMRQHRRESGFTLIELAVVVFLITLLLGSVLVPLRTQVQQRQISETTRQLEEYKETLIGFANQNQNLPCPDKTGGGGAGTANDGVEDVEATGLCTTAEGNLPWVTLGVVNSDVWGNRLRYRVTGEFAQRDLAPRFTLLSTGNSTVCTTSTSCTGAAILTNSTPAVIVSHGRNGSGAFNAITGTQNPLPASNDELENTDSDATFVSRPPSETGAVAGEFDDIVAWLSSGLLFSRMVAGGQLP